MDILLTQLIYQVTQIGESWAVALREKLSEDAKVSEDMRRREVK